MERSKKSKRDKKLNTLKNDLQFSFILELQNTLSDACPSLVVSINSLIAY